MSDILERLHGFRQSDGWIFGYMLFSSLVSLTASLVLSIDAVELARDANAALSCNINQVISCGKVGVTWQANLLGFPNAFLGLIAEPVVITIAVASLGKVRFPRGFMFAAHVVYTIGLGFAYWLFYQSMFHINALCPWCLLVTLSTTLVFTSLTHVNIRDNNLFLPERVNRALQSGLRMGIDALVITLWLVFLVVAVMLKYGPALWGA
ncbi:MAG: vitamin K epoxide reductase family protein [Propionicimonas sp.]|uniref:vitamin K epoxide reductase family protein n=1 Tax=Propionicimonas sp. TaxID=1955623 RepID=UPI002B1F32A2|nr:vitamin K epoxide reductase family protein [Propionicimonas sp.]MEA4945010.1 vitamin K epoxide reductase family protein [Propionicimonas sp.]MEA5055519.1 vitamin K epoxide reductase family protein [Propionicimonas sp.]MEA5116945.1 vitamin K epoxide reductase family protein [Propionicimonas sp.]